MRTLIIDNYDSFTYNLYHYIAHIQDDVRVIRNDEIDLEEVSFFDNIIISPGPGLPYQAGITMAVLEKYHISKRILGICLGHQAIVEFFGGKLLNLTEVLHGRSVFTILDNKANSIFTHLPKIISTGRYHSYVADNEMLPMELKVIAFDEFGQVQGVKHRHFDVTGLQFHPESIMTEYGYLMLKNWFEIKSPLGKL